MEISENAGYVFFLFLSLFSYLGTNSIDVVGQENKIESTNQMEYCPRQSI